MAARVFILIFILFTVAIVRAEDHKRTGEKKSTSINFEDELVEGEVKKPELLYLLQKKQFNFKRLIKLRENFLPEMDQTSESIGRSGESH